MDKKKIQGSEERGAKKRRAIRSSEGRAQGVIYSTKGIEVKIN